MSLSLTELKVETKFLNLMNDSKVMYNDSQQKLACHMLHIRTQLW